MQNVEHIDIPFDELGVFKQAHEQKYQHILIETLLLSTLATIHTSKKDYKSAMYVTMKSIWLIKKQKIKAIIPVKSVVAVVKSYKHPEMVIITRENLDNLRITTSSQQRCSYIISTLTYIFTYALNSQLCFISVKHQVLDYFQRTVQDKSNNKDINIDSYKKQYLKYKKPFKDMEEIYGHIKPKSKIILEKQLQVLSTDQNQNHLVYLARIKNEHEEHKIESKDEEKEDRYICHYVDRKQEYLQKIYEHHNIDFVAELIYAKTTDFKIQMLFEYAKSLRGVKITSIIFRKIWQIYDRVKAINENCVITTDSILMVSRTKALGQKIKRKEASSEEQELHRWIKGESALVVKEFRYDFLNQATQWDRFMYQMSQKVDQTNNEDQNGQKAKFLNKCYNIGLILYELATGRSLFSYIPAFINQQQVIQQQIQLVLEFKAMISKGGFEMFPKFMSLGIQQKLKKFIRRCIQCDFKHEDQMQKHEWLNKKSPGSQERKSGIYQQ